MKRSKGKVLHLLKTVQGAVWAYHQIRVLIAEGWDVRVVVPSLKGKLPEMLRDMGVELYECDLNLRNIGMSGIRLREIVKTWQPDLIHSHFVVTTYMMRMFLRDFDTPRIFQVPGPLHLEKGPYARIDLALSGKQDYWIGACNWTADKYRSLGVPAERVFMSHYGTDLSCFIRPGERDHTFRHEIGIPSDTPLVGMVAYMYPPKLHVGQTSGLKGHEDFIRAIARLREKNPDIRAVIVGNQWGPGDWYENKLKRLAEKECGDAILFTGYRKDINTVYRSLDLAVHPSHSENLGAASESMLMGIPTIASNVGGFPDLIKDGETGWLVEPKCPDRLAECIRYVFNHQETAWKAAEKGRELAEELLDVRRTGKEVDVIYSAILEERKSN